MQFATYNPRPAAEATALTASLLLAEHIGLYRWRGRLPLPLRYTLGVAAILVGLAHAGQTRGDRTGVYDAAMIAAGGGLVVWLAHGLRWLAYQQRSRDAILGAAMSRRADERHGRHV